eukprot:15332872-Ditylum_brightwellii.AAC.2
MDLFANGYPHHLSKFTQIEEMLIARVYPVMKTYWLQSGTVGCKGNGLNIEEEIQGQVVLDWLTFRHQHNPHYSDIIIDDQTLGALPEDGSMEGDINIVTKEGLESTIRNTNTIKNEDNGQNGPEQGGAISENDPDHHHIHEGYIVAPLIDNLQTENEQIRQFF